MIAAVRSDLPAGTVTFCFTDVEASTALLQELGPERYAEALAQHRRLLRDVFGRHGGVEVDTQGDAFFYVFPEAERAVAACGEVQHGLASGRIRLRIGLHTGTAHLTSEGYVGEDTHLGARIAASGHGGQVLLSGATRGLIDADVIDLGRHGLKDFAEPITIFQLGQERFPPLRTISNTNLPRPASVFVGRERETEEIVTLLADSTRFVTLTGPGGSGKTRLAIEVASELIRTFEAGVFWVGLSTLPDAALVYETIAETLGAKYGLKEHIGERDLLLVVDNVEHVMDAAPALAALLEECANLKLLLTSRERLRVQGEFAYAVPPLRDDEAVALFCQRSQLERDETIASLCRRLDNLPLAIELAAARTSVLSPKQILDRLSKRLDLLKGGRDADARQQTLRATIEWSHDLLSQDEQELYRRLSVFVGGSTLEGAEEVARADLDVLQSLVDKSLVRHSDERFWMLETIRQYAAERLDVSGEAAEFNSRYASYFLALAETAEPEILGISPHDWLDRLEAEHDNLRAALDWLETAGETERALALGGAIWEFWCLRGHYAEGWRRLEHLLDLDERRTAARAKALIGAVHLAANADVDPVREEQRADEALVLNRELGDAWGIAYSESEYSGMLAARGDFSGGLPLAEKSARLLRDLGDEHHALQAMRRVAWCRLELDGVEAARPAYEELLRAARAAGDTQAEARALATFAGWAVDEGRHREALELLQQVYRLDTQLGDPNEIVMDLIAIARAAAFAGRAEVAVRVLVGAEAMRQELGFPFSPDIVQMRDEAEACARAELDDEAFADAQARGRDLTREEAAAILDSLLGELPAAG
jgi:predicted ATPase/class 3 adenylate cyclase